MSLPANVDRNDGLPPVGQTVVFLPVPSLEAQHDFYHGVLQMELALDQGVCRIYRAREGSFFGFCSQSGVVAQSGAVANASDVVTDGPILTLVSDDVDAWYDHCLARGARVDGPPRLNERYQIYHFFAFDPAGYRVEVQRFEDPRWNSQA